MQDGRLGLLFKDNYKKPQIWFQVGEEVTGRIYRVLGFSSLTLLRTISDL